ncbi:MAG: sugar transferase [Nitrospirae bacterium]|nr:sugar transferase [Nitrospirota bacterium]
MTGGYYKGFVFLNRFFHIITALFFLILSAPVLILISLAVKLTDIGPVFYKGVRLGLNKKPFIMYKFRTLSPEAEQKIGAEILSLGHKLETKIGKLLRDTRLDELPQLFNIIKGDMDFVGPRPERPAIYEKFCRHIKNYDNRFSVKPGLIGFAQLFTPHSTPRKIRALLDNRFIKIRQSYLLDIGIIIYVCALISRKAVLKTFKYLWQKIVRGRVFGIYTDKRESERVRHQKAYVNIGAKMNGEVVYEKTASLADINADMFLIKTNDQLTAPKDLFFMLETESRINRKNAVRKKTAVCTGEIYREERLTGDDFRFSYVIKYRPVSPLNYYMIRQYFLEESIA